MFILSFIYFFSKTKQKTIERLLWPPALDWELVLTDGCTSSASERVCPVRKSERSTEGCTVAGRDLKEVRTGYHRGQIGVEAWGLLVMKL